MKQDRLQNNWPAWLLRTSRNIKKLIFSLAVCFIFAGCRDSDRNLLKSSVTLNQKPFIIVPSRGLSETFHFNFVCVKVPSGYQLDAATLQNPNGEKVELQAILTTTDGSKHLFKQEGCLQGGYVLLQADPSISSGFRYTEMAITSSAPLRTSEIRWFSTDNY